MSVCYCLAPSDTACLSAYTQEPCRELPRIKGRAVAPVIAPGGLATILSAGPRVSIDYTIRLFHDGGKRVARFGQARTHGIRDATLVALKCSHFCLVGTTPAETERIPGNNPLGVRTYGRRHGDPRVFGRCSAFEGLPIEVEDGRWSAAAFIFPSVA